MAKSHLTLIIPELSAILSQQINALQLPNALTNIIKKADFDDHNVSLQRLLIELFSDDNNIGSDLPMASLLTDNKHTLFADPCYLHPDRDKLLMFSNDLELTIEESTALITEIEPLLSDHFNATLAPHTADNWWLTLQDMPKLNLTALPDINGKSVELALPTGDDRQDWIRLFNEIQMKLYTSAVNEKRVAQGKMAINSVWFWGAGDFKAKDNYWHKVQGSNVLLSQLADATHSSIIDSTDFAPQSLSAGQHLWLLDEIDLQADWDRQLQQIDESLLQPLWQACRWGKLASISIHIPHYGCYTLRTKDCWKWWK